jgi:quercetin dioxygenase-like cupin family protein
LINFIIRNYTRDIFFFYEKDFNMIFSQTYKFLSLLVLCFMALGQAQAAQTVVSTPNIKWMDATDMPPGVKVAVLAGNPREKGHFVARVKFPANYIVPAHSHLIPEYDTVISGTYYLGEGSIADAKNGIALNTGDFAIIPAHSQHYGFTKTETILQISADGPWGMVYRANG